MQVKLIRFTPNPEATIAAAGKLCYSPASATEVLEKLTEAEIQKFIDQVVASGHHSVLEHSSFTFAIDGLSRAASHQLVRHRLASYSQQSQRYVVFGEAPEFVIPPKIAAKKDLKAEFEAGVKEAFRRYEKMIKAGIPAEDARYILPNAAETRIVMTMNFRELMHTCSVRLCLRAQWEIRRLFTLVKKGVEEVAPLLGSYMQPKCIPLGYCNERKSCWIRPLLSKVISTEGSEWIDKIDE